MTVPSLLDRQFNPRLAVADAESVLAARRRDSEAVARRIAVRRETYGGGSREYYLIAGGPEGGSRPAVIFIHGGYWRSGSAEDNLVIAPIESLGVRAIFLNYPLCPATPLSGVVDAVRRGVAAILEKSDELGLDPDRIVIAGTSAGAHLAAGLLGDKVFASCVRGALLLTGIYDLTPVPLLGVNSEIGLTQTDVHYHSPLFNPFSPRPSMFAIGGLEPAMWRAQTLAMAAVARASGAVTTVLDVPGRHHFDLLMEIAAPGSKLRDALANILDINSSRDSANRAQ